MDAEPRTQNTSRDTASNHSVSVLTNRHSLLVNTINRIAAVSNTGTDSGTNTARPFISTNEAQCCTVSIAGVAASWGFTGAEVSPR